MGVRAAIVGRATAGMAVGLVVVALNVACSNSTGSTQTSPPAERLGGAVAGGDVGAAVDTFIESSYTGAYDDVRAVLVIVDGEPVLERYYRGSASDTVSVHSVTKSVMSILVGIALDEGLLASVDQTLAELLPSYADAVAPALKAVTLQQLLTMTAGLPEDDLTAEALPFTDTGDWVASILATGADGPPGSRFAYSSASSHLLSAILAEATGRTTLEYARETLFGPLGIDTEPAAEPVLRPGEQVTLDQAGFAWSRDPQGHHLGYTSLTMSAEDMAKIGQLQLDEGRVGGRQVVSADWVAESTRAHVAVGGGGVPAYGVGQDFGYHWWVTTADGLDAFAAIGEGGQLIEVVPELGLLVVVSSDVSDAFSVETALSDVVSSVIVPAVR